MTAQAVTLQAIPQQKLRPFDMRRDLAAVADLVELCFAETLDADGRLYIRQMREAASHETALIAAASGRPEMRMAGYVWLEDGRVVGNLSLVPHYHGGRKLFLIANVAVHPKFRRHGIARELTRAALQDVQHRGRHDTWLQVDERNEAALALYREMGFAERQRRTSWRLLPRPGWQPRPNAIRVRQRKAADWKDQQRWLRASYPTDVHWQFPLDFNLLQPGWRGSLERAFSDRQLRQWSAELDGKLQGVLCWQSSSLEADRLWLAADAEHEDETIPSLLWRANESLTPGRPLALNYPSGRAVKALEDAGLTKARTLIWMSYPWR
jgi:ribosomal protein S18 acetylase RimI-like enzyme